jgi:hypothetical protein
MDSYDAGFVVEAIARFTSRRCNSPKVYVSLNTSVHPTFSREKKASLTTLSLGLPRHEVAQEASAGADSTHVGIAGVDAAPILMQQHKPPELDGYRANLTHPSIEGV